MSLVEVRGLRKEFGDLVAVAGLDLEVDSGEVVGLLGANGAGKTTAMRMILGILPPTAGEVLVGGLPVSRVDRRDIGYVPQGLGLYRDLTVSENLEFVAEAFGSEPISLSELEGSSDVLVDRVPLGLRRRVAFAAAQSHQPALLVLDEPTSGVGPLGRARLWEGIHGAAAEGAAILVSTHHMEEAEECDRVVMMAEGKVIASGAASELTAGLSAVAVPGRVERQALEELRARGGIVLTHLGGWRVVGLPIEEVRDALGTGVEVAEVPALFEEAFVARSR